METFYGLEEDVADVLFCGSSHCYCSVNPAILWGQHGIAGYNLGISGQDFAGTYHGIREALKTQHPRVICLEMYGSAFEDMRTRESVPQSSRVQAFPELLECGECSGKWGGEAGHSVEMADYPYTVCRTDGAGFPAGHHQPDLYGLQAGVRL